jgi:hypothetical protein
VFETCSWVQNVLPGYQPLGAVPGGAVCGPGTRARPMPRRARSGGPELAKLNVQISTPDLTVRTGAKVQTETRTGDAGATRTPHIRRDISGTMAPDPG